MTIPVTRHLIATIRKMLGQRDPLPYARVLKWDRNQPRGPKGSRAGGRWVKDVSAGTGDIVRVGRPGQEQFPGDASRIRNNMTSTPPGMGRTMGNANYADIMNAPTGEGFRNRPRGVGIPEPKAAPMASGDPTILSALKEGTVTDSRPLGGGGANASVIVTMDDGTEGVYKPERGENWTASFCNADINDYVTNRDFSLAARETFAFEVDQALGLGIVPETVLREHVDETNIDVDTGGGSGGSGGGYDEDYAREEYSRYKEKMLDNEGIWDEVGQRFGAKFEEAQDEHVKDIENRVEELQEIWDEEIENFPEDTPYGRQSALREHQNLPLGSATAFQRRETAGDALDPLEVLKDADVDVTAGLNKDEKERVRDVIRQKLAEGYRQVGELDEDAAKEHLDRDEWYEAHDNTEAEIRDSVYRENVQSFTAWRKSQGYNSGGGSGGGGDRNPDAPHPDGGSFQNFRGNADNSGDMDAEDGARIAVLDYVIGTMDRHPQNLMFENDRPIAIDNGYSMPGGMDTEDDFTFRSVGVSEWLHQGWSHNVPSDLRAQLHDAVTKTDWQALVDRHPGMNRDEREAFLSRVENMKIALQTEEGLRELWKRQRLMS